MTDEELTNILDIATSQKSLHDSIKESRYLELRNQLNVEMLERYIVEHPEVFKEWGNRLQ